MIWRALEPSAFITQISHRPVRLLWNAIRRPSGNHVGTRVPPELAGSGVEEMKLVLRAAGLHRFDEAE